MLFTDGLFTWSVLIHPRLIIRFLTPLTLPTLLYLLTTVLYFLYSTLSNLWDIFSVSYINVGHFWLIMRLPRPVICPYVASNSLMSRDPQQNTLIVFLDMLMVYFQGLNQNRMVVTLSRQSLDEDNESVQIITLVTWLLQTNFIALIWQRARLYKQIIHLAAWRRRRHY